MSLHGDALAVLEGWRAPSPEQERLRMRYVEHLRARPDGVTRACRPKHVTASVLVLDASGDRLLLTHHAKAGQWFQLGGHLEPEDETLAGAALREAVEESGLPAEQLALDPEPVVLDAHHVPFCGDGAVWHLDVMFWARAETAARPVVSEESLDVRWWPLAELPNPELAPFAALALSRARRLVADPAGPPPTSR